MTEAEWLAWTDSGLMLRFHDTSVSDRKSRLFRCAVCRRVWEHLSPVAREAIEVAEQYADNETTDVQRLEVLQRIVIASGGQVVGGDRPYGFFMSESAEIAPAMALATAAELFAGNHAGRSLSTYRFGVGLISTQVGLCAEYAACAQPISDTWRRSQARGPFGRVIKRILDFAVDRYSLQFERAAERIYQEESAHQAHLLRDVFGNPFRPVAFSAEWRTSTAVALAEQMYESRDFGAMPILADALQDAGCESDDVLAHCRDPHQVHVRGCWVVDLVLGKE